MRCAALALALVLLLLAGCGDDGNSGSAGGGRLKVSAASSLSAAFLKYDPKPAYSFAGSDQLAAQIKAGARPGVFAAANTSLPDDLYKAGLVEKPVVFGSSRLVIAPEDSSRSRASAPGELSLPSFRSEREVRTPQSSGVKS